MSKEYYTTVSASERFWESLVEERLESGFPITIINDEAGFTIKSKDGPAIMDMIELSNKYPGERFNVIITTNNKYKDVIEYYEFQNGTAFFNHLEPLYYFDLSEEVERLPDPVIIDEFKKEIIEALDRINVFIPSYEYVIGCENPTQELVSNIQFEYGCQNLTLTARVIGQTFIEIDMKSFLARLNYKLKNNMNKND